MSLAEVFLIADAPDEARRSLAESAKLVPTHGGSRQWAVRSCLCEAHISLCAEDNETALSAAQEAVELARSASMVSLELLGQGRLALAAARLGKQKPARTALARFEKLCGHEIQIEQADMVHYVAGRAWLALADKDKARQAFKRARGEVNTRRGRIKSLELKAKFTDLPTVKAIDAALRHWGDSDQERAS